MPESANKPRVLFVDDDRLFLEMVQGVFSELSKGSWDIHLASDARSALQILRERPMDLAVLDVYMPEVDGLQLLGALNRDHPHLPKVFLTGGVDAKTRVAGLEGGAELFLEKPTNSTGIHNVFATLNELVKWHQKQGARGAQRKAGLLDLVKIECVSGNSRVFEVVAPAGRGVIYVKDGNIVHAETEGRRGQSAFTHLAALPDADFNLKLFVEPSERSIYRQWEFLFLEAIQIQEQAEGRAREGAAPAPKPAEPAAAARTPKPAPASAVATPPAPTLAMAAATPAAPPPAPVAPPVAPTPPPVSEPLRKVPLQHVGPLRMMSAAPGRASIPKPARIELPPQKPAPARLDLAFDDGEEAMAIREMLICSSRNEVLHEWHCSRSEQRLRFLGGLGQKWEQLSGLLSLGACDRLEAQAVAARMIVQFQDDSLLMVRTSTRGQRTSHVSLPSNPLSPDWLSRHARARGLTAAGVFHPHTKTVSLTSMEDDIARDLSPAWRVAGELFELFQEQQCPAWLLRGIGERAQFYCVRREDGLALAVVMGKNAAELDLDAIGKMFAEFEVLSVS